MPRPRTELRSLATSRLRRRRGGCGQRWVRTRYGPLILWSDGVAALDRRSTWTSRPRFVLNPVDPAQALVLLDRQPLDGLGLRPREDRGEAPARVADVGHGCAVVLVELDGTDRRECSLGRAGTTMRSTFTPFRPCHVATWVTRREARPRRPFT